MGKDLSEKFKEMLKGGPSAVEVTSCPFHIAQVEFVGLDIWIYVLPGWLKDIKKITENEGYKYINKIK